MGPTVESKAKWERRARVVVKGKPFQPRPEEPYAPNEVRTLGARKSGLTQVSKVDWQSEKLTSEQGRFLNRTLTEFAQFLAPQLTPLLQLRVMVDLQEANQSPFKEFLDSLSPEAPLGVLNLDGKNKGLIAFDASIAYSLLDYLMGGKGETLDEIREFTEIESVLFQNQILTRLLSAFGEAWKEIAPADPHLETLEFSPNSLTLYPYGEMILSAKFILRVGIMAGHFVIAFPLKYIRTVLPRNPDQFITQNKARKGQGSEPAVFVGRKLETMTVSLTVELGKSEVYFQDLLGLEEGDIIRLLSARGEPLRIKVAGKTKFLGKPGASDKKLAIRITEVVQEGDESFDD